MGDDGIAGDRFSEHEPLGRLLLRQETFDAAMLVAELNFEMENFLAVTLKAKMSGLDHAGMDGTDSDLVDFRALNAVKGVGRVVMAPGLAQANGTQPGMALRLDAALFVKLAFEIIQAGKLVRERGIGLFLEEGENGIGQAKGVRRGKR